MLLVIAVATLAVVVLLTLVVPHGARDGAERARRETPPGEDVRVAALFDLHDAGAISDEDFVKAQVAIRRGEAESGRGEL
jgi:hypothetical protein